MNHEQIVKHSQSAYAQWKDTWRDHAKQHASLEHKSFEDFRNNGIGKAVLCVANGYSFEENIEIIKKYASNVDIMACDKTLGHLLANGIKPKYCVVCDARVDYEKYLKPYENQLDETYLFINVCANPLWSKNGNWKGIYTYVNKDVMNYEKEFIALSGCKNIVTAGTNVSNMMVVLLTQCDNERRQNLFSYDKILLIGFDYSWKDGGKYYAFDDEAGGKKYYMRHIHALSRNGNIVYTSNNLTSSASWLDLYVKSFKIQTVQCASDVITMIGRPGNLADQMQYSHRPRDGVRVRTLLKELHGLEDIKARIQNELRKIGRDHWFKSQEI